MIKCKYFWLAVIATAIIPLLFIDISQHRIDWQKEVREELIVVVQNVYTFDKKQKAHILDRVFERNQTLMFLLCVKSFIILILLVTGFYFFRLYKKKHHPTFLKPLLYTISIMTCFILIKVFLYNRINTNERVRFLSINPNTSIEQLYINNFKGKVVYVDFWGTTCGPCLQEFRDFTKFLKDKYKDRNDIGYLYVAQGNEYLWHEQIKKYNVEGYHIFLNETKYENLYRYTTQDSIITMPRYLILDKAGNIVERNAKRPSDANALYGQLNKHLFN